MPGTKRMRFTMRTNAIWLAAASLIAASCGGDPDCRNKERECAEGFACEERGTNDWQCLPRKAPASVEGKVDSEKRIDAVQKASAPVQSPSPAPAPDPNPAGVICPEHPMCAGKPAKCFCAPNGNLLTRSIDSNEDGKPDEKAVYESDGEGRIVQVVVDEGMDGSADSQHSYKYNDRGDPVMWQINRLTKAGDKKDQVVTYVYDSQGRLTQEKIDINIDGSIDSTCNYSPPCPPPVPNASCKPVCD
jgi:YD repeat-containing protein